MRSDRVVLSATGGRHRLLAVQSRSGPAMGWIFSVLLHGLLAWSLSDLILAPIEPLREPEPIVVQVMIVEPAPPVVAEIMAEPEDVAEVEPEPEPLPEPEEVAEVEPEPEPLPEPAPIPEPQVAAVPTPHEVVPEPAETRVALAPALESEVREDAPPDRFDLIFAIKRQMRPCWRANPQVKRARNEIVKVDVRLNQDGSVRQARIVDKPPVEAHSKLRAMANQAHAAVLDCSPFELPNDRYIEWQAFTLRFHPRGIY